MFFFSHFLFFTYLFCFLFDTFLPHHFSCLPPSSSLFHPCLSPFYSFLSPSSIFLSFLLLSPIFCSFPCLIHFPSLNQFPSLSLQFLCTVVAILLHYFFMSTFAWMFVEGLHIYRMQTEQRNINYGAMRFYYAIGWGVPAIITGNTCTY